MNPKNVFLVLVVILVPIVILGVIAVAGAPKVEHQLEGEQGGTAPESNETSGIGDFIGAGLPMAFEPHAIPTGG